MFLTQALVKLRPGAKFNCYFDDENSTVPTKLEWLSPEFSIPPQEEIDAEILQLKRAYDAVEYKRKRQPEYPPLADLADALYWQAHGDESKMTTYLAAIAAVKSKYPKE